MTFQLPDGESPVDCQLSITRQDIGRAQTVENISELDSIYLAPGVYDVELDYQAEADGTLYTYQDQLNITDTRRNDGYFAARFQRRIGTAGHSRICFCP